MPEQERLRVGLTVGLATTTFDLSAVLGANADLLATNGWGVAPEAHDPLPYDAHKSRYRHASESVIKKWSDWLPTCGTDGALLTCVHLANALLVGGEARALVSLIRARGDLRCGALVRRFDDYIATRYTMELLSGRVRRMDDRELTGRGVNNYLARIAKWHEAAGEEFTAILSPAARPEQEAIVRLLESFGVESAHELTFPAANEAKQLDAQAAETLRRFNRLLTLNELEPTQEHTMRAQAVSQLAADSTGHPVTMPAKEARALLQTFAGPASELASFMSADDREQYLDQSVQPEDQLDDSRVEARLRALADELGVRTDVKRQLTAEESAMAQVRRHARRARVARTLKQQLAYKRSVRKLRETYADLPDYQEQGVRHGSEQQIPHRVVQFWDPAPPPDEMIPWLRSWEKVGIPGCHHEVADYQRGLAAVEEVAGELGRQAFEGATHAAVRSDLFRYAELHLRGGWYVDAEHEALLPIPDVIQWPVDHVFATRPGKGPIVNNFIGAVAGSELMKLALMRGCQNLVDRTSATVMQLTGPEMLTRLIRKYMKSDQASYVLLPSRAVFGGVLQDVHDDAEYKVHDHWRYMDLSTE